MTEQQRRLLAMNEQVAEGTRAKVYGKLVTDKIRLRYSLSEELAILRQRDEKPEEFAAYNAYAEQCKAEAKAEMGGIV